MTREQWEAYAADADARDNTLSGDAVKARVEAIYDRYNKSWHDAANEGEWIQETIYGNYVDVIGVILTEIGSTHANN
jgi:hypothetical protein